MLVPQLVLDDTCSKAWAAELAWSSWHFVTVKIRCMEPGSPQKQAQAGTVIPTKMVVKQHGGTEDLRLAVLTEKARQALGRVYRLYVNAPKLLMAKVIPSLLCMSTP